jgi:activating signal cointegrator complex subunit 1
MVGPRAVDLGAWDVDEVQICEMGSHGPENEYVSCGGVSLP